MCALLRAKQILKKISYQFPIIKLPLQWRAGEESKVGKKRKSCCVYLRRIIQISAPKGAPSLWWICLPDWAPVIKEPSQRNSEKISRKISSPSTEKHTKTHRSGRRRWEREVKNRKKKLWTTFFYDFIVTSWGKKARMKNGRRAPNSNNSTHGEGKRHARRNERKSIFAFLHFSSPLSHLSLPSPFFLSLRAGALLPTPPSPKRHRFAAARNSINLWSSELTHMMIPGPRWWVAI